jgi:hypothetical protein
MVRENKTDATKVFKIDTMSQTGRNTRGLETSPHGEAKVKWALLRVAKEERF